MRIVGLVLQLLLAAALAVGVGTALGWLSRSMFVVGLVPITVGLLAGAAVGFVGLLTGGPWRWPARVAALLAVAAGWLAFQAVEDHHYRQAYREGVARARAADTGAPLGSRFDDEQLAFLASDADELLERQVVSEVGHGGAVGRWLARAESGIRMVGSFDHSRGLAVGRVGAIVWAFIEVLLAWAVALLVLRRVHDRARVGLVQGRAPRV